MSSDDSSSVDTKRRATQLPETFQQRGLYLPFTTALLRYARIRRLHGGSIETLIPGLTGGTETYVVPYKMLPEVISLTVFDRALHEEIMRMRDLNPSKVREIWNLVGQTGLGGHALARRAKEEKTAEAEAPTRILYSLVQTAIEQLAPDHPAASSLDTKKLSTPEGVKMARDALGGYAQTIGERGDKVFARLETWVKIITPVGAPDGNMSGYLTKTLVTLDELADDLSEWLLQEPPETGEMAQRTVMAVRAVTEKARESIEEVWAMVDAIAEPLRDFGNTEPKIRLHVEQAALILDGWQRVCDLWNESKSGDRFLQRDTLEGFAQQLPILPEEILSGESKMWVTLRQSQARWAHNSQRRVGSDIDSETQEKLSQFRKEPA